MRNDEHDETGQISTPFWNAPHTSLPLSLVSGVVS